MVDTKSLRNLTFTVLEFGQARSAAAIDPGGYVGSEDADVLLFGGVPRSHWPERCNSRTKSAMLSVSPRRDGSMLADKSRSADSLPEPAHSANALRDVLRRCAKAMSMSSNTCRRNPPPPATERSRSGRCAPVRSRRAGWARTPSATPCRSRERCRRSGPSRWGRRSPCHRAPRRDARRPRPEP